MSMVWVNTRPTQLDHSIAMWIDALEGEFLLGIQAAHSSRSGWGQQAVGANHLGLGTIQNQQVFAVRIEIIHIMTRQWGVQGGSHFSGKNVMSQALGLANFIEVLGPFHDQARLAACGVEVTRSLGWGLGRVCQAGGDRLEGHVVWHEGDPETLTAQRDNCVSMKALVLT